MGRQRYRPLVPNASYRQVSPPYTPPVLWPGIEYVWETDGECSCPHARHNGREEIKIINRLCVRHGHLKTGEIREGRT